MSGSPMGQVMRAMSSDDKAEAAELDAADDDETGNAPAALWWEADPQLRARFHPGASDQ